MTIAQQYRAHAAECLQTAQHVAEQGHLAGFVDLAQKWLNMADRAEDRELEMLKVNAR